MVDKSYYQMVRPEIVPLVPVGARRFLEIGCAAGGFRRNFKSDVEYWGVEPVEDAACAAERAGIKVLRGTYEDVENLIPDGYFDVVVCNDVIEHIVDTNAFLTSVRRKLKTDGCIVGSIPNIRFVGTLKMLLLKRDWAYADSGIMDRTHVRFFTPKSFMRALDSCGFEVEVLKGICSRRLALIKVLLKPIFWMIGEDLCHMQYCFRGIRKD